MRTYNQIAESLGYDFTIRCPYVIEWTYFAYKGGKAIEFYSMSEAKAHSKNAEKVENVESKKLRDVWYSLRSEQEHEVYNVWHLELRTEYTDLSEKLFNVCFDKAWDEGHSNGCDEVTIHMEEFVTFANDILSSQNVY